MDADVAVLGKLVLNEMAAAFAAFPKTHCNHIPLLVETDLSHIDAFRNQLKHNPDDAWARYTVTKLKDVARRHQEGCHREPGHQD